MSGVQEKYLPAHEWFPGFADILSLLRRRLNTLNKCAMMKLEISPHRKRVSTRITQRGLETTSAQTQIGLAGGEKVLSVLDVKARVCSQQWIVVSVAWNLKEVVCYIS